MIKLFIVAVLLALSGCSSFKMGAAVYCPHGMACSFLQTPMPSEANPKPTSDFKEVSWIAQSSLD